MTDKYNLATKDDLKRLKIKYSDLALEKANKKIKYYEQLTFTKGIWAGKQFKLMDWERDLTIKTFGTLKPNGMRQYRFVYVEIPKKNGKTEWGAATALAMLTSDNENRPEVYSAAADKNQASLVYDPAAIMVGNNETLSKRLQVRQSKKRIAYIKNNGFYQVLSADVETKHGLNPSCVIFDELHAQPHDKLWRVLTAGTDYAREQQLIIVLTTAGVYNKNSIWWRIREKARQVQSGIDPDDTFLPVLYIADPEKDDPLDEEVWKRNNPALGQIFTLDKIRKDAEIAKKNPIDWQDFLRFRLNIPIKQLSRWMPMDKWHKCNGKYDLEALKGRLCYGGLDLASKIDLATFILVFPPEDEDGFFDVLCKFYCPEIGILERANTDKVPYLIWKGQGHLIATPGDSIDYEFIEKDILDAHKLYNFKQCCYDPWNAKGTATNIMKELNFSNSDNGFQMIEFRQGPKSFNEPSKDLLVKVMKGKVRHCGNPILDWNADNLVMRRDANANIAPDKEKATEKIDGMVALIMAWSRGMFSEENKSAYKDRGILFL